MTSEKEKQLILIVDDSPQNLQVLGLLLEEIECDIAVASNGKQAIEVAKEQLPDLILLDIMMPVMDGYEACRLLKEDPETKEIPVIFLTALSDTKDLVKGFKAGAVDYVSKPFNGVELLARVNSHLKMRKMVRELEYANSTKNKFFSIIAHDLKNPFYTIIGFAELLIKNIETSSNEDKLKYIQMIYNSGTDAHALLENLLNWSRIQIGTIKANMSTLSAYDLVERAVHFLEPMASRKSIRLEQDDEDDLELLADEDMMNTILRNLGSNAIKFTNEGGIVKFITRSNGNGKIKFSVSDTGIGMSEEIRSNLFRIDAKQSRKGTGNETGTGLGLVLCKEFTEFHGGSMSIDSEEGKGSTFVIEIPISRE